MPSTLNTEADVPEKFIDALKVEIADLERQLHADTRYMKVIELKRVMELYVGTHDTPSRRTVSLSGSRPFASGAAAAILSVAKEVLAGRTVPTPIQEIMQALAKRGVHVGGSVPRNSVSSIMSKSPDFTAHGRSGWTLANSHDTEKAGDESFTEAPSPALSKHRTDHPGEPRAQGREAVPEGQARPS